MIPVAILDIWCHVRAAAWAIRRIRAERLARRADRFNASRWVRP